MTDTIRDLLISLASHMARMEDQLEVNLYSWHRESVRLRQKVTDVLADEPAVPEGREPAAVIAEPSDEEVLKLAQQYSVAYVLDDGSACHPFQDGYDMRNDVLRFARAALARWGNLKESLTSSPPADGEVAECAAELLQRQALVPEVNNG